jgi:HlyD family secretion protein
MKKILLGILIAAAGAIAWWLYHSGSSLPEVPFARVQREALVSTLSTNGKVEPIKWVAIRAERSGIVNKVLVQQGEGVKQGATIAELDAADAKADLTAAEARIAEARAQLEAISQGGPPQQLADVESSLAQARLDQQIAERDLKSLQRLYEKQAATREQVDAAQNRLERARLQIKSLEKKRAALVTQTDRAAAEAKLKEANASAAAARLRIQAAVVRSPIAGVVYALEVRHGAYVNPGDAIAKVGEIDKVRVHVYVDEPELGRVSEGVPVKITWDAYPGKEWKGTVERMPTEVTSLGTRQVGVVLCIIQNPGRDLLPGTNVNAEIRSAVVSNALTIPREAIRRQNNQDGVFLLQGNDEITWRKVELGIFSTTRIQILSGLKEGDSVALPTEEALSNGMKVKPVYPG